MVIPLHFDDVRTLTVKHHYMMFFSSCWEYISMYPAQSLNELSDTSVLLLEPALCTSGSLRFKLIFTFPDIQKYLMITMVKIMAFLMLQLQESSAEYNLLSRVTTYSCTQKNIAVFPWDLICTDAWHFPKHMIYPLLYVYYILLYKVFDESVSVQALPLNKNKKGPHRVKSTSLGLEDCK